MKVIYTYKSLYIRLTLFYGWDLEIHTQGQILNVNVFKIDLLTLQKSPYAVKMVNRVLRPHSNPCTAKT